MVVPDTAIEVLFVQKPSDPSGKTHRILVLDGTHFKAEKCNLDDVSTLIDLSYAEGQEENKAGFGCQHCWKMQPQT